MARRTALQGICNDLLAVFFSRNNDLDGYWAMGQCRNWMDQASEEKMVILLISERSSDGHVINELSRYFSAMLSALVIRHGLQQTWVAAGRIVIQKANSDTQQCSISLVSDLGRKFDARLSVFALPHDPSREFRRREDHWVIRT